jgi:hypothetical protein
VNEKSSCVAHFQLDALIVTNFTIVGNSEIGNKIRSWRKSRFHSLTPKKANKRRKLVQTPDDNNRTDGPLGPFVSPAVNVTDLLVSLYPT